MIIIHGTAVNDADSRRILSGQSEYEVSAHYYIDDNGGVERYVDVKERAWHAGKSYWAGMTDINSLSIGIELLAITNDGSFTGPETFYTDAQIDALCRLIQDELLTEYPSILPHHILGHEDIAHGRKVDPGPYFPWAKLAERGIGVWHDLQPDPQDAVLSDDKALCELQTLLLYYGYDARAKDLTIVIKAFQTHFLPWHICGKPTRQTLEAARILVKKKFA